MTSQLEIDYRAYIARARADGAVMAEYQCPSCWRVIETLVPDVGDQFDTLSVCPFCDRPHFKIVDCDGSVHVTAVGDDNAA